MPRFWLGLWGRWSVWLSLFSIIAGAAGAAGVTLGVYVTKGMPGFSDDVLDALNAIGRFSFAFTWSAALLLGMLLSVRRLFGRCIAGYHLVLLGCDGADEIASPRAADTLKVWRKWLFAVVWIVAAQVIAGVGIAYVSGAETLMGWFSVFWLYGFVLTAGLATLPLMSLRCKNVKVRPC